LAIGGVLEKPAGLPITPIPYYHITTGNGSRSELSANFLRNGEPMSDEMEIIKQIEKQLGIKLKPVPLEKIM
jgi:hypothetical protein